MDEPLNQCPYNNVTTNDFINLGDWASAKQALWYHWIWFIPLLVFVLMVVQRFDAKGSTNVISKYFGRPVNLYEFVKGAKLPKDQLEPNEIEDSSNDQEIEMKNLEENAKVEDDDDSNHENRSLLDEIATVHNENDLKTLSKN